MSEPIILTWSMVNTWRSCRRKFFYEYKLLLISSKPNMNFYTGGLLHYGVNHTHLKHDISTVLEALQDKSSKELVKYMSEYASASAEDEAEMRGINELIQVIIENYSDVYKKKHPKKIIAIEIILSINDFKRSYNVIIKGKIDEIVQMKKPEISSLYEIKSTKSITTDYVQKYVIDGQTMTYVILAESNDYSINDIVLDCIKKPQIRRGKKEPEASYYNRLLSLYSEQKEEYFYRDSFPITLKLVKEHYRSLENDVKQISDIWDGPEKYYTINTSACFVYGQCPYLLLCKNGVNDVTVKAYQKKPFQNMELVEEETN